MIRKYDPFLVEAPLCDPPYLKKEQIRQALRDRGVEPPRLYELGFQHANCGGFCVKAGQAQFRHLLVTFPERYAYHEAKEQELREYLGKDVAILRDRRGGTTHPMTLREFRKRLEAEPSFFDELEWGGCGCFAD